MESNGTTTSEKGRNYEKRKEKSRDAARCRRTKESEIFSDLAKALPLSTAVVTHLDKASIMRLVLANLRMKNMIKAMRFDEENLKAHMCDQFYLQSIGGLVLVISLDGDIIYVSNNVFTYLGISQVDLLGQSFFDIIHPCDHQDVRDLLSGKIKISGQVSTFVRVKCSQISKGRTMNLKTATYKVLHIVGRFLPIDEPPKERVGIVTIATAIPHPTDIEPPLGSYSFLSKHSLDMKFTYADERMTNFLGYNPDDIIGESMYNFHHVEDNREIMKSFKSLFEKGQSETCLYRFMAQGGGYIWVCTQATVLYCDKKNVPLSVICVNYVISGKYNEIEICSREQVKWVKVEKSDHVDIPAVLVKGRFVSKLSPINTSAKCSARSTVVQAPSTRKAIVRHVPSPISMPVKPEQDSPEHSPRPRPATSEIFGPRTADMNKGFLMFSDDESGLTILKEEPEDLTHLAPTAGDVCVPLSIPPLIDGLMSNILPENYSPLINGDKDAPLFSSYSNDSSRSFSPALTQSSGSYSSAPLCSLSDDDTTILEEETMKSLLGLDLLESENDPEKTGYLTLSGSNGLPLLTTSDFPWDVSPPCSPTQNDAALGVEMKPDPLTDFSSLASLLQVDDRATLKKCPSQDERSPYTTSQQRALLDLEKRKRISTLEEETVKKRKHGPITRDTTPSVLMNLLIEGHDVATGYTCFDSRTINGHGSTKSCLHSVDP